MQVARRLTIVITWTVLGIIALICFASGSSGIPLGTLAVVLAVILTFAFNWVFADKKSKETE